MDDLFNKMQSVLSDPESMQQLKELAELMGNSSENDDKNEENNKTAKNEESSTADIGFDIGKLMQLSSIMKNTQNDEDTALRCALEELAEKEGAQTLYERLRAVDPASCESIHANNVKRVIRALEFYEKTGKRISQHNKEQRERTSPYQFAYFVLQDDRDRIYQKIEERVDLMLSQGLMEEVRALRDMGCTKDMVSMQGLGYKESLSYLEGEITLEEAVYLIKRDTRHFAKRQFTWFRREKDVIWIDKERFDHSSQNILLYMQDILQNKGIILQK